jgi:hypothetical protein
MIPPLPLPSKVLQSPLKLAAAIPNKVVDTASLRKKPSQEMTKLADLNRAKHSSKHRKSLSHTSTPSNSDEDRDDLRGMLKELHDRKKSKTLEESKQSVNVVYENRPKPYDASSRQYGHSDQKGSSAKSGRERSG